MVTPTRGARAAGEGRFATDAASGPDASSALPGSLLPAPEKPISYRRNRPRDRGTCGRATFVRSGVHPYRTNSWPCRCRQAQPHTPSTRRSRKAPAALPQGPCTAEPPCLTWEHCPRHHRPLQQPWPGARARPAAPSGARSRWKASRTCPGIVLHLVDRKSTGRRCRSGTAPWSSSATATRCPGLPVPLLD